MDINKTTKAHQCPYCNSLNTDEASNCMRIGVNEYEGSAIPTEFYQYRVCKDCGAYYTAYFTSTFYRSEKN